MKRSPARREQQRLALRHYAIDARGDRYPVDPPERESVTLPPRVTASAVTWGLKPAPVDERPRRRAVPDDRFVAQIEPIKAARTMARHGADSRTSAGANEGGFSRR